MYFFPRHHPYVAQQSSTFVCGSFKSQNLLSSTFNFFVLGFKAQQCGPLNRSNPRRRNENAVAKTEWTKKKKKKKYRFYFYSSREQKKMLLLILFYLMFFTDHKYDRPTTGEHVFVNLFCSGKGLVCTVRCCTVIGLRRR